MDLPTYTNIWRIEKRLYKLYDFRLPMPLPVGTFGVALGVFALWVVLLSVLNAPFVFGNGWHLVLWVVPPGVITVLATRPVVEGKRLTELLISQARFLTEARVYNRLAPEYEPAEVRVAVRVWHRHPEAGPLPLTGRRRRAEREAAVPEVGGAPAKGAAARSEAPPLRGVAAPADHDPVVEDEPVYTPVGPGRAPAEAPARSKSAKDTKSRERTAGTPARSGAAPLRPDTPERRAPAGAERVPVAVAARPDPEERRGPSSRLPEEAPGTPEAFGGGTGTGDGGRPPRRGIGRRVLDYFGLGLGPEAYGTPEEVRGPEPDGRDRPGGPDDDFAGEAVYETEGEEQRDSDAWFARLRASSGQTPVGLTSKSAYSVGDTAAMSRDEMADAVAERQRSRERSRERVRAEEVAHAPVSDTDEETPAARRLRGRTQGIQVTRDLEERRSEGTRERGPKERRAVRARGQGLPDTGDAPEEPRRREDRPHAAPWELGEREEKADPAGYADMSDYAARYAAATGRSATDAGAAGAAGAVPWLPPSEREGTAPEDADAPRTGEDAAGAAAEEAAGPPPSPKPALQLDHGTGEQEAMSAQPREEPEDRGPEWNEHMSVLDQHLSTADTPAPPRPKFADAAPARERGGEVKDPSEWFEDGRKRHPDQPKVGDRGNPVIPANELREEDAAPSGSEDAPDAGEPTTGAPVEASARTEESKPPTQLDHGTGELVSFVEVRDDSGRGDANVRADADTEQDRRRTAADLEKDEAAALARRREAARSASSGESRGEDPSPDRGTAASDPGDPRPASRGGGGAVRDPRANPSMAEALAAERSFTRATYGEPRTEDRDPSESTAPERPAHSEGADQDTHEAGGPHDGVFHRVAQNARRIGHLFGQPAPGEEPGPSGSGSPGPDPAGSGREHESGSEPRPALELDHGTGEQERLGDTPNGVPSQASGPAEARPEEPAGDSGGTRGWRRLAKVVTGGAAPVRSDLPASDIERLRTPLDGPRSLVVLGCTGGAGQTVTTLMVGHTLAAHRDDHVVAVDVNPGPNGLSRRIGAQTPETLTALLANAGTVQDYSQMGGYTSRTGTGLEVVQTLDDPYVQTLDDRDYGHLASLLGGFYGITLLDPAATGVARALPVADGLVLVAPANADAERAVSMTFDWLDGNGYGALRARSVLVVNGVSKRSLQAVDAAERVARGRCRAIVRIPWDDHLGSSYTRIDVGALRPATKRAHGALGGVLVNSLTSLTQQ
ncbi:TcpE family conjugal transfer membrane protein [Nocardiopsis quinghaiensis]|uniref:TcpE family conjugal transfer membrane protein n=1 Tax=Nocardiopsis quinghaiensis TaxID=464995 RepID=UPI00123BC86F|nr:TcpE family conjugal transfer membrane protein [Nocardiopsis quinghaiensis]